MNKNDQVVFHVDENFSFVFDIKMSLLIRNVIFNIFRRRKQRKHRIKNVKSVLFTYFSAPSLMKKLENLTSLHVCKHVPDNSVIVTKNG